MQYFIILPKVYCEDLEFQNYLKDYMADEGFVVDYYLFREETNSVNCATYDRLNDISEIGGCATTDFALEDPTFANNDTSCVIGIDLDPSAQSVGKNTDIVAKSTAKDTDIVSSMKSLILGW